jgi:hypothetical protein
LTAGVKQQGRLTASSATKGKRFQAYNGNFGHVRETFGKPHNGLQDQLLHGFAPGLGRCVWRRSAAQIVPS